MSEKLTLRDKVFLLGILGMLGSANLLGYGLGKGNLMNIVAGLGLSIMFAIGNVSMYGDLRSKLSEVNTEKNTEGDIE